MYLMWHLISFSIFSNFKEILIMYIHKNIFTYIHMYVCTCTSYCPSTVSRYLFWLILWVILHCVIYNWIVFITIIKICVNKNRKTKNTHHRHLTNPRFGLGKWWRKHDWSKYVGPFCLVLSSFPFFSFDVCFR